MFDALSRLYKVKNINRKMALRAQLKNVKLQFVLMDEEVANVLTKLLVRGKFEGF